MNPIVGFCLREKIVPNVITSVSIAVLLVAWWFLRERSYELALFLLLLVQFSDILDGAVAKAMEKAEPGSGVTRLGEILDPARDKLLFVGTLFLMPWVSSVFLYSGLALESMLALARPFQWLVFRSRKIDKYALPANGFGKWKMVCENIALIGFLLQKCRPEYIPLVAFGLAMVFGTLSLVVHVRNALDHKPSLP